MPARGGLQRGRALEEHAPLGAEAGPERTTSDDDSFRGVVGIKYLEAWLSANDSEPEPAGLSELDLAYRGPGIGLVRVAEQHVGGVVPTHARAGRPRPLPARQKLKLRPRLIEFVTVSASTVPPPSSSSGELLR